jgi:5-methylcytosine-specific restriction endonuclease McrA
MNASVRQHETGRGQSPSRSSKQKKSKGRGARLEPVIHPTRVIEVSGRPERADRASQRQSHTPLRVLQLDVTGVPQSWMTTEAVAVHMASGSVAWQAGDLPLAVLRGGINAQTGLQSTLEIPPIIALRGQSRINLHDCVPVLTNQKLFKRDRMTCCYCGGVFRENELTREHIVPTSRKGEDKWSNVASACSSCNGLKGNWLLSEIKMELLYMPYVPSLYEDLLLRGRHIRADVHEWLISKLPKGSRLS